MKDEITVIVKEPGFPAYRAEIGNTLKDLQAYVGGYIETVTLASDLVVICNEEGRIMNLQRNCMVAGVDFVGTILLVGVDGDEFDDCPLMDENIAEWIKEDRDGKEAE